MKKILSLALCLIMLISSSPVVFATGIADLSAPKSITLVEKEPVVTSVNKIRNIDSVSVHNGINIDGTYYDLYCTFSSQEKAMSQIGIKCKTLIETLSAMYNLDSFGEETWPEYCSSMYRLLDDANCPSWYTESNSDFLELRSFFDIYENYYKNQYIIEQINCFKSVTTATSKTKIHKDIFLMLPYTSTEAKTNIYSNASANSISGTFNKSSAIAYAKNHATSRNLPKYHSFLRGDCTNFASQILESGGVKQVVTNSESSGWWHKTQVTKPGYIHTHSNSWTMADVFANYFGVSYKTTNNATFSANIRAGDFIALDAEKDGDWDHIGFVVAVKSTKTNGYYDYQVAQHTTDYLAWTSSSTNNWETQGSEGARYGRIRVS